MNPNSIQAAAALMWQSWCQSSRISTLPATCRPATRSEGYAIQAEVARLSGQRVLGWKIAATSAAGQQHIRVDGPLAGRLLASRVLPEGAGVHMTGNIMRVGEAEFAFRMAMPLPPRETPYDAGEVLAAVRTLHPAIEVPDTRFTDCTRVGAAQLIADHACAAWFVLGAATDGQWRERDLVDHRVTVLRNGSLACEGRGANVLGDPRLALTWLANELSAIGEGLKADDIVTTGTCVVPFAVAPGDRIRADFGDYGSVEAALI
jgi:2-keto-4-pentenoate hydratase